MKTMNPDVIGTTYGELVIDLVKTTIAADGSVTLSMPTADLVGFGIRLADELILQLDAREVAAKALAEASRVILPVDWSCDANDDPNRSGQHWSQPETDALVAQFKNGRTGSEIAVHHRRTWAAVSAQLAKYGLLRNAGGSTYERANGDAWVL